MEGDGGTTSRRRAARRRVGPAAVVALLALGAACGGVSGEVEPSGLAMPDPSTDDQAEEVDDGAADTLADPVRKRLIEDGDEICADEFSGLQNLPAPSRLSDAVTQMRFIAGLYRNVALRMRGMPAPTADADVLELMFVQLEQIADLAEASASALEAGDQAESERAQGEYRVVVDDLTGRMRAYGFERC